ncbi:MAG: response regulator [Polyangiales bacterium]
MSESDRPVDGVVDRSGSRGRVLIIDDERRIGEVIAAELDRYDVVVLDDGLAALSLLVNDRNFDAILCDLMMPVCSGIDVYERATLLDPSLRERFIVMTGGAFTARAEAFLATTVERLEKPFGVVALHEAIDRTARRRRTPQEEEVVTPRIPPHRPG